MRLLFVGEGVSDVGADGPEGVIPILTRRHLAQRLEASPDFTATHQHLYRLHQRRGYPAKVRLTVREAHRQGFDGVVIVVDRDCRTERLGQLREGRDRVAQELHTPVALGVAVETLEAWLLADEQAIRAALRLEQVPTGPDPETLDGAKGTPRHPKVQLASYLNSTSEDDDRSNQQKMEAIAHAVDLGVLRSRCPRGFGAFAAELRCLEPLFESTSG